MAGEAQAPLPRALATVATPRRLFLMPQMDPSPTEPRSGLGEALPFLGGWLRDPVAVGLPFTSSPATARRLAEAVLQAGGDGPILELGGGTGAVTASLLELGCEPGRLVVIERDAGLSATLRRRFPDVRIVEGDALRLDGIFPLDAADRPSFGAVLSGLPMRAIPADAAARCYRDAFRLMPPAGAIVQYTYGWRPPVDPRVLDIRLDAEFVGREWRNVPPVAIWRYRLAPALFTSAARSSGS